MSVSRPAPAQSSRQIKQVIHCCRCDRTFLSKNNNFPKTQSTMYHGNEGYLPWCKHCVDELFEHYATKLSSEKRAAKRLCSKFDVYWNESIFDEMPPPAASSSVIRSYISKVNSYRYRAKTYDDTIDELEVLGASGIESSAESTVESSNVNPERAQFWGPGFTARQIAELDDRYRYWTEGKTFDNREEEGLYRQIAMTDWQINKTIQTNGKTEPLINAFNSLLGSANIKAKAGIPQNIDEKKTLGVRIAEYEMTAPIPEPTEEFKDPDNIKRFISIWFYGHMCKMLRIKNSYSKLYEEELAKFRVERPEYQDTDDEATFDGMFEGGGEDL